MEIKKLEYREFRKVEYYLTPRSIERESIPASKDQITIKVIDIDHTNSYCIKVARGGFYRNAVINNLGYSITNEEKIEVVEYNGDLYHTILTDDEGNIYLR